MPIVYEGDGDLFTADCQTLLCPVNSVGAMGRGLALAFAKRYPAVERHYLQTWPRTSERRVPPTRGRKLTVADMNDRQQCLLFPTKLHWRDPSPRGLVGDNLRFLAHDYEALGIESLAMPLVGCGLGGLDWRSVVRPLVYQYLHPLPVRVVIVHANR